MKKIEIQGKYKGNFVLIDSRDYEYYNQWKWSLGQWGVKRSNNNRNIYLARLIMNCPSNFVVDHINGNSLDNRRSNLRICTSRENSFNSSIAKNNVSGFKGVSKHKLTGKWESRIGVNRKKLHLGLFNNKRTAAMAYNIAAKKYFGEFAKLNDL